VARALPSLLVVALLAATGAAFGVTESQKLQKAPILRTQVDKLFSPVCGCTHDHATIRFYLRKPDRLTVTIRRGSTVVSTLVRDKPYRRGWVNLQWNGSEPSGILVADGVYKPYVHLVHDHRTIGLPNPITVDTAPPRVLAVEAKPLLLSPDGDGRGDVLTVRYRLQKPGRGLLYVDGVRRVRSRFARTKDELKWYGMVGGKPLPRGQHRLAFAGEDPAGNVSARVALPPLTIRYVTLGRKLVSIGPHERFYIRVSADAKIVHWRFASRTGQARPGTLVLRAPRKAGRYRLYVWEGSHSAAATVRVERIG
jgi:hypothetical protein